uniref:Uncharacterized protein n=1 Tax=Cucumis melo TaxID=3656 RepID=A0A9I9EHC3_CUCME
MDPGPVDDSHLYLQAIHRSQSICDTSSIVMNWISYMPDIMASLPLRCRSGQAYDFVDEVQAFSVEHDIEALGNICDRTTGVVEQIIQQTRRLNVADTDRRHM